MVSFHDVNIDRLLQSSDGKVLKSKIQMIETPQLQVWRHGFDTSCPSNIITTSSDVQMIHMTYTSLRPRKRVKTMSFGHHWDIKLTSNQVQRLNYKHLIKLFTIPFMSTTSSSLHASRAVVVCRGCQQNSAHFEAPSASAGWPVRYGAFSAGQLGAAPPTAATAASGRGAQRGTVSAGRLGAAPPTAATGRAAQHGTVSAGRLGAAPSTAATVSAGRFSAVPLTTAGRQEQPANVSAGRLGAAPPAAATAAVGRPAAPGTVSVGRFSAALLTAAGQQEQPATFLLAGSAQLSPQSPPYLGPNRVHQMSAAFKFYAARHRVHVQAQMEADLDLREGQEIGDYAIDAEFRR